MSKDMEEGLVVARGTITKESGYLINRVTIIGSEGVIFVIKNSSLRRRLLRRLRGCLRLSGRWKEHE